MLCFLQRQQLAQPPRAHDSACHLRQDGPALAQPTGPSRSALLRLALLAASATLPPLGAPHPAHAAAAAAAALPPIRPAAAAAAAGGPRSSLLLDPQLLPMPPGPIAFPRRQLDLNFAVLLLRSGYEACDDLDFVPMDEFQKRCVFWKLRQSEWEPYLLLHSPLRILQGQLTDPLYCDFIISCQAFTASAAMREGRQVFEEYDEESEAKRLVSRDPALSDNALLPERYFERHGELIYRGLVEGFRGEQFGGPPPCAPGASSQELLAGVQRLLDIFVAKGFALKATLTPHTSSGGGGGGGFTVRLDGPANLWSLQALAARRSSVYQQHDAAAVAAFLRASGRSSSCRLAWSDTAVTQEWSLQA
ncbi:hypothetical protein CHLNCDRAFT_134590 [Chlorella variabilis]|uniref:Uncharacterized protein n=1 Tax=Chlorella variabilis TaxID=554065 RepID=E1ZG95_CHLVA|nr:hypothetical protein CHLNCDRAFT_134590 [Chlorella variabilis]EFN55426.1 hypothetical protein CHLNCDRAFT_134590 [Chlorella variabilis]|eukprot:XP_005847528.1 hypothetical protein CHLNCDRAFT_134590 [Chlorella variabilis]